ncbi:hypothetical protein [Gymnodinialimonas ceratoperidinii]|uniref:Uncharacterized protein n=1 Tax=Gymnodinialimonas ceratoperidinii TaxID=2856823 RepID=A0A8F6TX81_9RHOB|nr:hypothetical protein [Gymnodinialimonas ceratoperidinii]QXT39376.1 hypothetical protein KYE46_15835 [Gymnodinialimonas ceratoperidinii]
MKTCTLAIALTLLAAPAFAQSEVDRLEAASVSAGANMEAFLVSRVPEIAPAIPDWEWDEEMRTAAACTLDAIRAEGGDAAVETYLDEMDVFAEVEITSMEQMATVTPVPINPDFAMQTGQACGTAEIAMRRMQESGLMEAMMVPDVMGRLMN